MQTRIGYINCEILSTEDICLIKSKIVNSLMISDLFRARCVVDKDDCNLLCFFSNLLQLYQKDILDIKHFYIPHLKNYFNTIDQRYNLTKRHIYIEILYFLYQLCFLLNICNLEIQEFQFINLFDDLEVITYSYKVDLSNLIPFIKTYCKKIARLNRKRNVFFDNTEYFYQPTYKLDIQNWLLTNSVTSYIYNNKERYPTIFNLYKKREQNLIKKQELLTKYTTIVKDIIKYTICPYFDFY
jgi:hypothetical protein